MNLLKVLPLSVLATSARLVAVFAVNKIAAVHVGPTGLALIGQFQNFISVATSTAKMGTDGGVTKYIAEYHTQPLRRTEIISSAATLNTLCSLAVSASLLLFRRVFSLYIFHDERYALLFVAFGFFILFFVMNGFFLAVFNGLKDLRKYYLITVMEGITAAAIALLAVKYLGLMGILLSPLLVQPVVFALVCALVARSPWCTRATFFSGVSKDGAVKLLKFSLMTLATVLTTPLVHMLVRNYLIVTVSLDDAGYWQGLWQISQGYLAFVTLSLSTYYLPRLSELGNDFNGLRKEIHAAYKVILPLVILSATALYVLREQVIRLLYSGQFLAMKDLFFFQLLGDFFKITSWLLSFLMVARAMTRLYIMTELIFGIMFLSLAVVFVKSYGLIGVTYAFALNYLLYLFVMIGIFRRLLFSR